MQIKGKYCLLSLILLLIISLTGCGKVSATTMKVIKVEGVVSLENNGKQAEPKIDQKILNGNKLSTGDLSLASISLDDVKIVTLDESSSAEFTQEGKKLALNLTEGNIFFNVKEHLADDESFIISTSTMVVGIRGTSGYVSAGDSGVETLIITDGKVTVTGINPLNGEREDIDVNAGEKLTVTVVTDGDEVTLLMEKEEIMGGDLPEFAKSRLYEDGELLARVYAATGWDDLRSDPSDESGDAGNDNQVADAGDGDRQVFGSFVQSEIYPSVLELFNNDDACFIKNYFMSVDGNVYKFNPGFFDALESYKIFDVNTTDIPGIEQNGGLYLLGGNDIDNLKKDDIIVYAYEEKNSSDGSVVQKLVLFQVAQPDDVMFAHEKMPSGLMNYSVWISTPGSAKMVVIESSSNLDYCAVDYYVNDSCISYTGIDDQLVGSRYIPDGFVYNMN